MVVVAISSATVVATAPIRPSLLPPSLRNGILLLPPILLAVAPRRGFAAPAVARLTPGVCASQGRVKSLPHRLAGAYPQRPISGQELATAAAIRDARGDPQAPILWSAVASGPNQPADTVTGSGNQPAQAFSRLVDALREL